MTTSTATTAKLNKLWEINYMATGIIPCANCGQRIRQDAQSYKLTHTSSGELACEVSA